MITAKERRQGRLLEILTQTGTATVGELEERLGVGGATIRRDLELLESQGLLKRFHGGAKRISRRAQDIPFPLREITNAEEKRRIGERVASLISDGAVVLLDGGSTALAIAEHLVDRELTICPLSLRVAWALAGSTAVKLILPGGAVRPSELSISGPDTSDYLRGHHFDAYIMTAAGISPDRGLTEWSDEAAAVKRTALSAARRTIAAINSQKFDNVGFVKICDTDVPSTIVIDDGLSDENLQALLRNSSEVIVA